MTATPLDSSCRNLPAPLSHSGFLAGFLLLLEVSVSWAPSPLGAKHILCPQTAPGGDEGLHPAAGSCTGLREFQSGAGGGGGG